MEGPSGIDRYRDAQITQSAAGAAVEVAVAGAAANREAQILDLVDLVVVPFLVADALLVAVLSLPLAVAWGLELT